MTAPHPDFGYRRLALADIPGLVEGAAENRGLGHRFLRHVERCAVLLLVIDAAGVDGRDPVDDYRVLLRELGNYDESLLQKPRRIAANKTDLPGAERNRERLEEVAGQPAFPVCAELGEGVESLLRALF
jgi:GTP-binding protein